ncbi:MAG: GNAT family N-acetyltransferase [Gammaproteobacteria bacterium]|nr:MAG: GNAT family N-acetyltransferase [Gammaproteobacteria bacterium]
MKDLQWRCNVFQQLDKNTLYEIIKLRIDIFVVEQKCPYPELDEKDRHDGTLHLSAHDNEKLIAYARLLPPGLSYAETSIGRFAVESSSRQQGIGSLLIKKCLDETNKAWPKHNIKISAQEYLQEFYEKFGFIKVSSSYLEDYIPHIEMLKDKNKISN